MSAENLSLWSSVEKTPVEHTKPITGKPYSGNSPKPHYLIHRATETFGPCGIGWGFTVEERLEDGAMLEAGFYEKLHIAKVRVWYKWNGERGEVEHIGGTVFSGRRAGGKVFSDEDAPKKSVTDALVKALSMIGFAGDIFMGRYDDSKYMAELKQEAAESRRPATAEIRLVSNGKPIELSSSQRMAQEMCAKLWKVSGEAQVKTVTDDADFRQTYRLLDEEDAAKVKALISERRAI